LAACGLLCLVLFLGAAHLRYQALLKAVTVAAESKGTATADAKHATAALEAATQAAADFREAEAETPVDADREFFKKLCGKSASCRSRSKYAGASR
jgi:hypothetical protein